MADPSAPQEKPLIEAVPSAPQESSEEKYLIGF
jgi:hypothetical protein